MVLSFRSFRFVLGALSLFCLERFPPFSAASPPPGVLTGYYYQSAHCPCKVTPFYLLFLFVRFVSIHDVSAGRCPKIYRDSSYCPCKSPYF